MLSLSSYPSIMKIHYLAILLPFLFVNCQSSEPAGSNLQIPGLQAPVEVLRDAAGINHIYAQNQQDLFFAQGYCAARDRLFQFEIWRRQATGTVAEILGERELQRDIGTRLFKFRGDMTTEMNYYHENGAEIITAYTDGVNAYIEEVLQNPDLLPVTFKALDILPEKWTPEVVISRHQGLLGNITTELSTGRAVAKIGVDKVKKYNWFHPKDPNLDLDASITSEMLDEDILELYNAYRTKVVFQPEDIQPEYRATDIAWVDPTTDQDYLEEQETEKLWIGSNNWVTRPALSANGHAYMANDPHRTLAVPSLRYWVHLSAPGWDVIGGGEPEIPGVSIGHNQYGAWGLTVFRTDGEDLYVYDLNPENLNQYKYQDQWVDMDIITEQVKVKGKEDVAIDLRYTQHGPVTFIDSARHKAYAVKCAWMEPGGAPYLASLRMDQAKNWEEFRAACNYSHIPGENMIWADKEGNIGWQAVGIAPLRRNFSGMVPVPGDGSHEWDGYLPIVEKPNAYNPASGFIATANQNVTPEDYIEWDAVGFSWSDPFRGNRVNEVLSSGKKLTMDDMKALQTDYLSIPARTLVPTLASLNFDDSQITQAAVSLAQWDFILHKNSSEAAIYVAWENALKDQYFDYFPDAEAETVITGISMTKLMGWILNPTEQWGTDGAAQRDAYLRGTFSSSLQALAETLGEDMSSWTYGSLNNKHVRITHPLGKVVNAELREKLNTDWAPRGGNQYTSGATGSSLNQSHGATFRFIVDVNDWDASVGANSPGQSGDPESTYYDNLFSSWANDEFFVVPYSRAKVEAESKRRVLKPM